MIKYKIPSNTRLKQDLLLHYYTLQIRHVFTTLQSMGEWKEGVSREETLDGGAKVEPPAGIQLNKPWAESRKGGAMVEPYQVDQGG